MHHFFVTPQQISGDKIRIEGGDVNHMKNVLRMKLHEKAEISDGESRTYLCEVEAYEEDVAVLHILEEMEADTEPASKAVSFPGASQKRQDGADRTKSGGAWRVSGDSCSDEAFCCSSG